MDETLRAHRDTALEQIAELMRRGRQVKVTPAVDVIREWQRDCAAVINQLSGGSKAHWLARAYSSAFLVRADEVGSGVSRKPPGRKAPVLEAPATEIVDRILDVLAQARTSLSGIDGSAAATAGPPPRRFEFVHNPQLRPLLAQAFIDSGRLLEEGDFESAFVTSCGILEAIITDALEHKGLNVSEWTFDARIDAAQREGLIGRGCVRLPAVARSYRDVAEAGDEARGGAMISARDARVVRQVLLVVMRDLDPGR
jgi:hypothetical protein